MRITALVLSWNALDALEACLTSLQQQSVLALDVLVVDNASDVSPAPMLQQRFPAVELLQNPINYGFAGGMNRGLHHLAQRTAAPDVIVLINQDTVLAADCLAELTAPLQPSSAIAACGALMFYPDGRLQHAGVLVDAQRATVQHYDAAHPPPDRGLQARAVDCLNGAVLAVRPHFGGQPLRFDEGYAPAYFEDIDLCRRLTRAGGHLLLVPTARVTHHEGLSTPNALRRASLYHRGRLRYLFKHHTPAQLLADFLPAELAALQEHFASPVEGRALRWAYDMTLSQLRELLTARSRDGAPLDEAGEQTLITVAVTLQRAVGRLWQQRSGG